MHPLSHAIVESQKGRAVENCTTMHNPPDGFLSLLFFFFPGAASNPRGFHGIVMVFGRSIISIMLESCILPVCFQNLSVYFHLVFTVIFVHLRHQTGGLLGRLVFELSCISSETHTKSVSRMSRLTTKIGSK